MAIIGVACGAYVGCVPNVVVITHKIDVWSSRGIREQSLKPGGIYNGDRWASDANGRAIRRGLLFHQGRRGSLESQIRAQPIRTLAQTSCVRFVPYLIIGNNAGKLGIHMCDKGLCQLRPFACTGWRNRGMAGCARAALRMQPFGGVSDLQQDMES